MKSNNNRINSNKKVNSNRFDKHSSSSSINYEVVVVDNASTDGSVEMLRNLKNSNPPTGGQKLKTNTKSQSTKSSNLPTSLKLRGAGTPQTSNISLKLIINKQNLGFAKANNQAARISRGEYLFFLNTDTYLKKGTLIELATLLETNDKIGAVSPLVLNKDGSVQKDPCYLKYPSPFRSLIYYNAPLKKTVERLFPQLLYTKIELDQNFTSDQLPGAALMIRKSLYQKIGGFDSRYPIYFEDTDLCWHVQKVGYQLIVNPGVQIVHLGRKSIQPVIAKKGIECFYFLNFRSLFLFCEKNYPRLRSYLIKNSIYLNLIIRLKINLVRQLYFRRKTLSL